MPEQTYCIAKWSTTFETADSRKHKTLHWVSLPNRLHSSGYQSIVDTFGDDTPAIYGAWCALLSVAASLPDRGILASSRGKPVSLNRIARLAYMPVDVFERLFEWASSPEVGWLERVPSFEPDADQLPIDQQPIVDLLPTGLPNQTPKDLTQRVSSASEPGRTDDSDANDSQGGCATRQTHESTPSKDDMDFAHSMFGKVVERFPKTKEPNFDRWADKIRLMRIKDGHSLAEIQAVFQWANTDGFWWQNIRSPDSLRKNFPLLHGKMIAERPKDDHEEIYPPPVSIGNRRREMHAELGGCSEITGDA